MLASRGTSQCIRRLGCYRVPHNNELIARVPHDNELVARYLTMYTKTCLLGYHNVYKDLFVRGTSQQRLSC